MLTTTLSSASGTLAPNAWSPELAAPPPPCLVLIGIGTPVAAVAPPCRPPATAFRARLVGGEFGGDGVERADLVVELGRPAQVMIGDGDRRELARADRRGQLGHG
jgi:hypothetical protein